VRAVSSPPPCERSGRDASSGKRYGEAEQRRRSWKDGVATALPSSTRRKTRRRGWLDDACPALREVYIYI
jgi:hypothetical protein